MDKPKTTLRVDADDVAELLTAIRARQQELPPTNDRAQARVLDLLVKVRSAERRLNARQANP